MKITITFFLALLFCLNNATSQVTDEYRYYQRPDDPLVQKKLAWWQGLKFGLLMHWGPYSQWGVVESWSICSEDEGWTQRKGPYAEKYSDYVRAYENLQTTFNPVKFSPEKWAAAAKDAGMKYVVFTTKHHDGFCMFDTKQTDYKITDSKTPFHSNPRANVAKEIFAAFRNEGFGIGAYFSKPDWHCPEYWWPYFATPDRNVNYDPKKYPDKWQKYKDFTFKQIEELVTGYGPMDILWLDGGWVRPKASIDTSVEWERNIYREQDVNMQRIAAMARGHQPGILVVDRSVGGKYENYRTPEQELPEKPLDYPWETCMTMATSWSYVPNDTYKPASVIIHNLVKIISRGGNYLLNIGPSPDGEWDPIAYERLREIGAWMKINGEAVYGTQPIAPYQSGNVYFVTKSSGETYAIALLDDKAAELPVTITWSGLAPKDPRTVRLLGSQSPVSCTIENGVTVVRIPDEVRAKPPYRYAWVVRI